MLLNIPMNTRNGVQIFDQANTSITPYNSRIDVIIHFFFVSKQLRTGTVFCKKLWSAELGWTLKGRLCRSMIRK